jgi:hypothetical protein
MGWLDRLLGEIPLPKVAEPPIIGRSNKPAQNTVKVNDTRGVGPSARIAGKYSQRPLEDVVREAKVVGAPPDLAVAMAIHENGPALQDTTSKYYNPLSINPGAFPNLETGSYKDYTEPAMIHMVNRAAAVSNQGRERQIQAFNGLGRQKAGYHTAYAGQANPYAKAVEEIRQRAINVSPDISNLIKNVKPTYDLNPMDQAKAADISHSLDVRRKHPKLLSE